MIDLLGYGPAIMRGAWLTVQLAFLSLGLALLLGLATASAKLSSSVLLRSVATVYTTLIRGVPDLVLMLMLFYGGQIVINLVLDTVGGLLGVRLSYFMNPFIAGVLTMGFIFGAYMGETFRGAFMAVSRQQLEAGYAYGLSRARVFFRIMVPQMTRHALPGLGNNWQVLLKTTALVSILGLNDMVLVATRASRAEHEPFLFFIPVAVVYLALTAGSELGIKALHRRVSRGVIRA